MEPPTTNPVVKKRFTIDTLGWKKVGKGALIAGLSAVLTALETSSTSLPTIKINNTDITLFVAMFINSVVVNLGRKFIMQISVQNG